MTTEKNLEGRRHDILAAARISFETNGYAATTMDEVAGRAGVSKGSIYNYFSSKHDLFSQLFSDYCTASGADFDRMVSQPIGAAEKLNNMLDNFANLLGQHRRFGSLVLEYWAAATRQLHRNEFSQWFKQTHGQWQQKLAAVIAEGISEREFRDGFDPEIAASIILAIFNGIVIQAILDPSMKIDDPFLTALKRAIVTALAAKPAQPEE
jgi:AcrR family transcriptional regulator